MCIKLCSKSCAELKLSKAFYSKEVIDKASKMLKEAKIKAREEEAYFHITIESKYDAEKLALEYCNLLLALLKGSAL